MKGSGGLECTICEALVKIVDSYIETNETEVRGVAWGVAFCDVTLPYMSRLKP